MAIHDPFEREQRRKALEQAVELGKGGALVATQVVSAAQLFLGFLQADIDKGKEMN